MVENTFSRRERLHCPTEFRTVYEKGKRLSTRYFTLFYKQSQDLANSSVLRLGITVKKGVGKANQRNYIKRLVRETFRQNKSVLHPGELVVMAKKAAAGVEGKSIVADFLRGLKKIAGKRDV